MNPCSQDIADILAAAGLSLVVGTNLFIGDEPESPASCTTIFDTPGYGPMLTFDQAETYDFPAVQVRIRNTSYLAGYALIHGIKRALHGLAHEIWNGTVYELIKCDQDPFLLDYDESRRPRFVCNFSIQRK